MHWSPQQSAALDAAGAWLADPDANQVFRLFGFAGTGKTTLAVHLARESDRRAMFASFTGKAALVMRKKGCSGACTLHSLIYTPVSLPGQPPEFEPNPDSPLRWAGVLIIDEVSMVNAELALDVLSFGRKVLVLGDPAQLPPVRGSGYFIDAAPDAMLTEVHRQAEDNPIVRASMNVRLGHPIDLDIDASDTRCRVLHRDEVVRSEVLQSDQILVGRNRTRTAHNARNRELRGYPHDRPVVGDKLVCLRNDREKGLLNGGLWRVTRVAGSTRTFFDLALASDDLEGQVARVLVNKKYFSMNEETFTRDELRDTDHFTYGYALTVHKSQGSEWLDVVLFDESSAFGDDAHRWLYTGITRAAEKLTIVR